MKQYKQLPIPKDSAWSRKSWKRYAPIWFKEFVVGCNNLIKWFPTIWKQRDWDDSYIFDIIKQKLIFQRKELVNANRHTTVWQTNRDITICLNLIERLQEEYYRLEYWDYKINKDFIPYFVKYINQYKKLRRYGYLGMKLKKEDSEKIALWLGDINQERAQKLLFKILNERINHWWD